MAAFEDGLFGKTELSFGPAQVFWDSATGGLDVDLGGVDSVTVTKSVTKIELREAQAGDRPADKAISAMTYEITLGMSRATIFRLENVVQGFEVQRDTANNPVRFFGVDLVGQRDSSIAKQLTVHEIVDGQLSSNPLEITDFLKVAPSTESTELVYDAATQRYYAVAFLAYKSETIVSPNGEPVYYRSRLVV